MESAINELKQTKVLAKKDIISLRNHINEVHPYADSKKKASLLSFAIYKTIDDNLDGFSYKYKQKIKQKLIRTLISKDKELIDKFDIFITCSSLEKDSNDLVEDLTQWVNNSVKSIVRKEVINDYIRGNPEIAVVDLEKNKRLDNKKSFYYKLFDKLGYIREKIYDNNNTRKSLFKISIVILLILLITIKSTAFLINQLSKTKNVQPAFKINTSDTSLVGRNNLTYLEEVDKPFFVDSTTNNSTHIPHELRYKNINENKLKSYLRTRNSILEDEPYFSAIMSTAKDFDLNPIVLFSITGQEQGFVPRDHPNAEEIANNPFNVYESWQKYNTDIKDSTEIASRTVINHLKGKPEDMDPFQWVNRKYAEHKEWWVGVRILFDKMESEVK